MILKRVYTKNYMIRILIKRRPLNISILMIHKNHHEYIAKKERENGSKTRCNS